MTATLAAGFLLLSHLATAGFGWYLRHKSQVAALDRAAREFGPAAIDLLRDLRHAAKARS